METGNRHPRSRANNDPTAYFRSPISTLLASLKDERQDTILPTDLIQAYSVFSTRVKRILEILVEEQRIVVINYLRDNASTLSRCLARDINRAATHRPHDLSSSQESQLVSFTVHEDNLKEGREYATLTHQALLLVADLSVSPRLSSLWTDSDSVRILQSILTILDAPVLPTPGPKKTCGLAMWALSFYHVSPTVFASHGPGLLQTLASIIADDEEGEVMIGDALMVLRNQLVQHTEECLSKSFDILDRVFRHLTSHSQRLRVCAAQVLAALARVFVTMNIGTTSTGSSTRHIIRTCIMDFFEEQLKKHKTANSEEALSTLPGLLLAEIPQSRSDEPGPHVGWAFSVLVAVIVLSDGKLFLSKRFLRSTFQMVFQCQHHSSPAMRKLHAYTRRSFAWAMSRLPYLDDEEMADTTIVLGSGHTARQAAFLVVSQYLPHYHVGTCLLYVLLGPPGVSTLTNESAYVADDDNLGRVVKVLLDLMCSSDKEHRTEGLALLSACTRDPAVATDIEPWNAEKILPTVLLSGELIDADNASVDHRITSDEDFQPLHVRPWNDVEISQNWDGILAVWEEALFGTPRAHERDMESLLCIWDRLLRVQANTSTRPERVCEPVHIKNILGSLLDWEPRKEAREHLGGGLLNVQLSTVRQLWLSAKTLLSPEDLRKAASSLFVEVLQKPILLKDRNTEEAYSNLCSELFLSGDVQCFDGQESLEETKVRAWNALAASWVSIKLPHPWENMVTLLRVPVKFFATVDSDRRVWARLFETCMKDARQRRVRRATVLEALFERIDKPSTFISMDIMLTVLPHLRTLNENDVSPIHYFKQLNQHLCYPPQNDDIHQAQKVIRILSTFIPQWPVKHTLSLLLHTKPLVSWIHDKSRIVLDADYRSNIIPFYCNTLEVLRTLLPTPSPEVLHALDTFLASPFEDTKRNTEALHAFKSYWDVIQKHVMTPVGQSPLPPGVERSLGIYYYIYRSDRPPFFSDDSMSQSQSQTSMNTVPDSQLVEQGQPPVVAGPTSTNDLLCVRADMMFLPSPPEDPRTPKGHNAPRLIVPRNEAVFP